MEESFDWRESNTVTPVRSQAQCGSCWAFAAMAALEGVLAMKSGILEHLSTQTGVLFELRKSNERLWPVKSSIDQEHL